MSSKRGRKRNDNLPPNRARDVQRAFRARRAAHLQALEDRVTELEEENDRLRAALNLPAANRPLLGKGPTGKDKGQAGMGRSDASLLPEMYARDDSPSTTRTSSSSPTSTSLPMGSLPPPLEGVEGASWDKALVLQQDEPLEGDTSRVQVSPFPSTSQPYQFEPHSPSATRPFVSTGIFLPQSMQNYPHSSDRPTSNWNSTSFARDQHYSYGSPPFSTNQGSNNSLRSPSTPSIPHSLDGSLSESLHQSQSLEYGFRRSITTPQHSRPVVNHFPRAQYPQQTIPPTRPPSSARMPPSHPPSSPPVGYGGHEGLAEPSRYPAS